MWTIHDEIRNLRARLQELEDIPDELRQCANSDGPCYQETNACGQTIVHRCGAHGGCTYELRPDKAPVTEETS